MAAPRGNPGWNDRRALTPMQRFLSFCRFEPETGCVVWTGGKTQGRGHHVPYGSFWFEKRRWFAHRWAAKYIHGLEIEAADVDHCCPNIPKPNTLCVEHLQAISPARNRELQTQRNFIHLQVGLITYQDLYGPDVEASDEAFDIPFFTPPKWFGAAKGTTDGNAEAPF